MKKKWVHKHCSKRILIKCFFGWFLLLKHMLFVESNFEHASDSAAEIQAFTEETFNGAKRLPRKSPTRTTLFGRFEAAGLSCGKRR